MDRYTCAPTAGSNRRERLQAAHDPAPRIRRVDHCVDLEVRSRIDGLTPFIGLAYEKLEGCFTLRRIVNRRELFSEGVRNRPFETHGAEFP